MVRVVGRAKQTLHPRPLRNLRRPRGQLFNALPSRHFPDTRGAIPRSRAGTRSEMRAIRTPHHRVHVPGMPFKCIQTPSCTHIPDAGRTIPRAGSETCTIRVPRHRKDPVGMSFQSSQTLPCRHIPDTCGAIFGAGSETCPIRVPRYRSGSTGMPSKRPHTPPCRHFPDTCGVIP